MVEFHECVWLFRNGSVDWERELVFKGCVNTLRFAPNLNVWISIPSWLQRFISNSKGNKGQSPSLSGVTALSRSYCVVWWCERRWHCYLWAFWALWWACTELWGRPCSPGGKSSAGGAAAGGSRRPGHTPPSWCRGSYSAPRSKPRSTGSPRLVGTRSLFGTSVKQLKSGVLCPSFKSLSWRSLVTELKLSWILTDNSFLFLLQNHGSWLAIIIWGCREKTWRFETSGC